MASEFRYNKISLYLFDSVTSELANGIFAASEFRYKKVSLYQGPETTVWATICYRDWNNNAVEPETAIRLTVNLT